MAYAIYRRPKIITLICVGGFIFQVLFSMGSVFSPDTRKLGDFFPALFGLMVSLRFIAYVGIWYMKKWGVDMLMVTFAAYLAKWIIMDDFSVVSTVWNLFAIVTLAFYYKKMDRNL